MFWRRKTNAGADVGNRLELILYHFVSDARNDFTLSGHTVSTGDFRRHLEHLAETYTPVRWSEIPHLHGEKPPRQKPWAAVCFDDGYRCILEEAYPFLERMRIPAAMFINLSVLGNKDLLWRDKIRLLLQRKLEGEFVAFLRGRKAGYDFSTLSELGFYKWSKHPKSLRTMRIQADVDEFLREKGYDTTAVAHENRLFMEVGDVRTREFLEFGNHTVSHPIMTLLSRKEQRAEIGACHEFLLARGISPVGLSLPFSPYNRDTLALCREFGYPILLTVYERSNIVPTGRKDRPWVLNRWMAPREPAGFGRIP
jgi:peptidoglycan/xylan/chitin deacetylase (PgdA/CDA1 family)